MKTLRIVTYRDAGQLGNCLYRMGNLIAFCREYGTVLYDLGFAKERYSSGFASTCRKPLRRTMAKRVSTTALLRAFGVDYQRFFKAFGRFRLYLRDFRELERMRGREDGAFPLGRFEFHLDDRRVMMISGDSFQDGIGRGEASYFFMRRTAIVRPAG